MQPLASVAVIVKTDVPEVVGVPERRPVELSVSPVRQRAGRHRERVGRRAAGRGDLHAVGDAGLPAAGERGRVHRDGGADRNADADGAGVQRHGTVPRQELPGDAGAGRQGDARERENAPCERCAVVPRVAELPTCQKTLQFDPPLMT